MAERATVRIMNQQGLHARPISRFVQIAGKFEATVSVRGPDGTIADGRSIFSMMTLAAGQGTELVVEADGRQALEVLAALRDLVAGGFGET